MKYKVLSLAILAVILYSCAAKSTAPTAEVKPSPAPTTSIATVMTPALAEGKSLYDNNCAKCHRLYDAKEFTAEEWKPIVDRMVKKADLDNAHGQKIYNYLTMN
jgi:cytochrome c5